MSHRVKRPINSRSEDGSVPTKRRKRTTAEEEEAATLAAAAAATWPSRPNDLKTIYNRSTSEAPAELFRKDLISAMKLPDSEPLASNEYWVIVDQWKQEWERGVQVPVNPDSLPEPSVKGISLCSSIKHQREFKPPRNKYIRITNDEYFNSDDHVLSKAPAQSDTACSYDLDDCDVAWLKILNAERAICGLTAVNEDQLERVIERFEISCWEKIQTILKNEEGLGIEYDENVICDVCRSPDSEEGNEMVFCDMCNICVHQACYGITRIPDGQWLCCTCKLGKRPECVLCPNKGGAMKSTRSGQKWAHVSCALWIPEVSIGCVERMEPITKISSIPTSRWALICVLCRDRVGACIQCSVKTCKTAYHVTCAFKHGLEMRAIIEDENADDGVKLRSYCEKHSKSSKNKEKTTSIYSGSENDDETKRRKRKDMTSEEKNQARAARLQEIESEFHRHVTVKDVSVHLVEVDTDALHHIYNYWKLKRKAGFNKPLLPPKSDDIDVLSQKREQADNEKLKMFVQIRQDLERVRNLCYMVSRREKLSRSFFRMREQTFHKQALVLEHSNSLPNVVVQSVIQANHGPSIYDRLYSHSKADDLSGRFDTVLARIAGLKSPPSAGSGDEKKPTVVTKHEINGLFKDVKNRPYKKVYFNGSSSKRRPSSLCDSSSGGDEKLKYDKENRLHHLHHHHPYGISTSEDDEDEMMNERSLRRKRGLRKSDSSKIVSSSEEDSKQTPRSRLRQIEHELGISGGSDSDDLIAFRTNRKADMKTTMSSIYSDSDSSYSSSIRRRSSTNANNSDSQQQQQNRLRTKAAVKDFTHKPSTSRATTNKTHRPTPETSSSKKKTPAKKSNVVATELIVPQREAAKKASENLKSTNSVRPVKDVPLLNNGEDWPTIKTPDDSKSSRLQKSSKVKSVSNEVLHKKEEQQQQQQKSSTDSEKILDSTTQEQLAYVPQRQAAKKAAEHIKSGLGKVVPSANDQIAIELEPKAKSESPEKKKPAPSEQIVKNSKSLVTSKPCAKQLRSSSSSSSSSSSRSSSTSGSTSSSSSESDSTARRSTKPAVNININNNNNSSRRVTTSAEDWPFLDKGAKPAACSSSPESSDTSRPTTPKSQSTFRHTSKSVASNRTAPEAAIHRRPVEAQKKKAPVPRKSRDDQNSNGSKAGNRIRNADERCRNLSSGRHTATTRQDGRKTDHTKSSINSKETNNNNNRKKPPTEKLSSTVRTNDDKKKISSAERCERIYNLEKEILERKSTTTTTTTMYSSKTNSTLDRLFGPIDDKDEKMSLSSRRRKSIDNRQKDVNNSTSKTNSKLVDRSDVVLPDDDENTDDDDVTKVPQQKSHDKSDQIDDGLKTSNNHSRSIFSPQSTSILKDTDLLDFDNFENDGFALKDDEMQKTPLTFSFGGAAILLKEDSKEDSVRETLNLVEKLRMEYSKKSSGCDSDEVTTNSGKLDSSDSAEQVVPSTMKLDMIETALQQPTGLDPIPVAAPTLEPTNNSDSLHNLALINHEDLVDNNTSGGSTGKYLANDIESKGVPFEADPCVTQQGDERWVPPSDLDPTLPLAAVHPPAPTASYLSAQVSLLLPPPKQSPIVDQRRLCPPTSLIDINPLSMDCMASPSPYIDVHPQAKWADSTLMPSRRSSSSSAISTSSRNADVEASDDVTTSKLRSSASSSNNSDMLLMNHPAIEPMSFLPFPPPPPPPPPPVALDTNGFAAYPSADTTTQFPVGLFPAGLFPSPFNPAFPVMQKPTEETSLPPYTSAASFTSSQHNMALTAAMVSLQTTKGALSPPPSVPDETISEHIPSSPCLSTSSTTSAPNNNNNNVVAIGQKSPSIKSIGGKKSPSKPTRTSARVTSQSKSPSKSPCEKSPIPKVQPISAGGKPRSDTRNRNARGGGQQTNSRGRGRGRGRGRSTSSSAHHHHHQMFDYDSTANTIHNKLIGTVYDLDFDDDISNEADLKSMRERRKSIDQKSDEKQSPKFSSPRNRATDLRDLRPPTPILQKDPQLATTTTISTGGAISMHNDTLCGGVTKSSSTLYPIDMVAPVLPGPVDMRTYNNNFDQNHYNLESNLLGAFATDTAENHRLHEDIDEDFEKELHSALTASKSLPLTSLPEVVGNNNNSSNNNNNNNIKVSLSDARNQLKVKIKGPISNYSAPTMPPPPVHSHITSIGMGTVANSGAVNSGGGAVMGQSTSSGTSNLRRMRKKELLRQYWTQDMNMDDSTSSVPIFNATTPPITPVNRTIITIPKAVASMTSIPTKDDYRDYRTGGVDGSENGKKHRKDAKSRPGLRELRQLDVGLEEEGNKRRGRPIRSQSASVVHQQQTPKIKIKIGGTTQNSVLASTTTTGSNGTVLEANAINSTTIPNSNGGLDKIDDKRDRIRPPKKRLANINMPISVEDLKRESMKFRKLVMADFGETKRKKRDKGDKKRRHKTKSTANTTIITSSSAASSEVRIIPNETQNPTKLIIRFGKKLTDGGGGTGEEVVVNEECSTVAPPVRSGGACGGGGDKSAETAGAISPQIDAVVNQTALMSQQENSAMCNERVVNVGSGSSPPPKLTPIKLKLARCQEGSGYVMKTSSGGGASKQTLETSEPGQPPPSTPNIHTATSVLSPPPTTLPVTNDCQVR